ncbi:choline/carnitine/betaine transporter family protein [Clostridium sp. CAG:277]|nr:choline/carnitine/betaine transporter family protein [Clostridium sp. CAG:277]
MIFVTVGTHEQPFNRLIQKVDNLMSLLWCLLLIVLPIALVFSESSMSNIQSISIISAFPIGLIMIWSLFKDMKKYIKEK